VTVYNFRICFFGAAPRPRVLVPSSKLVPTLSYLQVLARPVGPDPRIHGENNGLDPSYKIQGSWRQWADEARNGAKYTVEGVEIKDLYWTCIKGTL